MSYILEIDMQYWTDKHSSFSHLRYLKWTNNNGIVLATVSADSLGLDLNP